MSLAVHHDELILQQPLERKPLALGAKPAKRRIQFASIKQLENVESAARPKIQRYPGSNLGDTRCDRSDENDRR